MAKKAAGERTHRISRTIAASTVAAVVGLAVVGCGTDDNGSPVYPATDTPTDTYTYVEPVDTYTYTEPTDTDTYTDTEPTDTDTYTYTEPTDTSTLPNSSPYLSGTCFNGPYITSTTPIDPGNMTEVDCNSSDAHYEDVQTFLDTTDLNQCNSVSNAQYAFSEQDTYGDETTWEAVYCLVGLGSYANQ